MSRIENRSQADDLKQFAKKAAIVAAVVAVAYCIWLIRHVLVLIYIAAVLAAGLSPVVRRVQITVRLWFKRRIRRGTAVLIVYLPFVIAAAVIAVAVIPRLLIETRGFAAELPVLVEQNILETLEPYIPLDDVRAMLNEQAGRPRIRIFTFFWSAVTVVVAVVCVLFMTAYMLVDAERLRNLILLLFPADQRTARVASISRLSRRMANWLGAQLTLAFLVGTATFVGLTALGIPYAIPLALLATVGEIVPVLGPILGAIPVLLVALTLSKWQFWAALALTVGIQQFENYVLVPRIMGDRVKVSPLAVFIAFLIGASLYGIVGAILAVPSAVVIQLVFEETFLVHRERRLDRQRKGTVIRYDAKAE